MHSKHHKISIVLMEVEIDNRLNLAYQFVEETGANIFLTGKAGTGKTTFLRNLKSKIHKRMIVVAPTGVAAINAGGVTIHSFFQLPFGPQIPQSSKHSFSSSNRQSDKEKLQRFSKEKINIIRSLDLLIIDEISMVRADLLDGIDAVLKRFRKNSKPFGGVQLLMIGDMQQLAPIARDNEWNILREYYDTVYFFSSLALKQTSYISIELKHIFRQSDSQFISLLNKVRNNQLDDESVKLLNSRFLPNFVPDDSQGYITLTTHNHQAQSINSSKLDALNTKPSSFTAIVEGDFPEHAFPTDSTLTLKEGAQVMFIKNDPSHEKLFYNGKIGKVMAIDDDIVYVECPGDESPIEVTPLLWENTKYSLDPFTKEINETITGTFTQYPLKLAWAITIHKSQGLTFDKAIIEANAAFAHGQVYVALSRCRSLEGLVLSKPIENRAIINDNTVVSFNSKIEENHPNSQKLTEAKCEYQKQLIDDLFSFGNIQKQISYAHSIVRKSGNAFNPSTQIALQEIATKVQIDIANVAEKFIAQVIRIAQAEQQVEDSELIQQRISKAIGYFEPKIENEILSLLQCLDTESDNKEQKTKLKEILDSAENMLNIKLKCFSACKKGFNSSDYIKARALASIEPFGKKRKSQKAANDISLSSTKHPELYKKLIAWRNKIANEKDIPVYRVLKLTSAIEICENLPQSATSLKSINGFGKKKIADYGKEILDTINSYRKEQGLPYSENIDFSLVEKPTKKKEKSHATSYKLFCQGKTIDEIAAERQITPQTVYNHLGVYIEQGELEIGKVVPYDKLKEIIAHFERAETKSATYAKKMLGESITFDEIRSVQKYLMAKKNAPGTTPGQTNKP